MRRWWTRRVHGVAFLGAAAMVVGAVLFAVSNWWVHRLGRPRIFDAITEVPSRDVAIVPGVGGRNGLINDRLRSRLRSAVALYRAHKVKDILMSGVGGG